MGSKGGMTDQLMILPESALQSPRRVLRKGHAGNPGRGPKAETCGSCANYASVNYHDKSYRKCELSRANWSHGPGTDIRKKDPACEFWKPRDA